MSRRTVRLRNGLVLPEGTRWRGFSDQDYVRLAEPLRIDPTSTEFRDFMNRTTCAYFSHIARREEIGSFTDRRKNSLAIAKAAEDFRLLLKSNKALLLGILDDDDQFRSWIEEDSWEEDDEDAPILGWLRRLANDARTYSAKMPVRPGREAKQARRIAWSHLVLKYLKETGKEMPGRSLGIGPRANGPLVRLLKNWSDIVLMDESPGEAVIEDYIESIRDRISSRS